MSKTCSTADNEEEEEEDEDDDEEEDDENDDDDDDKQEERRRSLNVVFHPLLGLFLLWCVGLYHQLSHFVKC